MNSSSAASLPEHRKMIFMLSGWIRQLSDAAKTLELDGISCSAQEMLQKVETSALSIAVVGEFKRGKSTLINALLGQPVLPTNVLPTTATLNRIRYGISPQVKIHFQDGRVEDIAPDQLVNYVTKLTPESSRIAAGVKEAVISYPTAYCQNDVDILDTPGLEDESAMTAITLSVLPKVDAAIFVTMALAPFSQSERAFLSKHLLEQALENVLFVITGIDRCPDPGSVNKIIQRVKEQIKTVALTEAAEKFNTSSRQYQAYLQRMDQLQIIGISAYQALQAKLNGDAALLSQSHFPELEAALKKLLEGRGRLFLQASLGRIISMSQVVLRAIVTRQSELNRQRESLKYKYEQAVSMLTSDSPEHKEALARQQKILDTTQQELSMLLNHLGKDLQQAASEVINKVSAALVKGDLTTVLERLHRLDNRVANVLENHSRRWAGKLQVELRRTIMTKLLEVFRPEPEQSLQWMHSVGFYSVNFGETAKTQLLEARLANRAYENTENGTQLQEGSTEEVFIKQFKSYYISHLENAIVEQLENEVASHQELYNQLVVLLESANPACWQPKARENWIVEKRLNLVRDETRIELTLKDLQALQDDIEAVKDSAQTLQFQLIN